MDELQMQINFLNQMERMKCVLRQNRKIDGTQENDAEHSWHLVLYAMVLRQYMPQGGDLGHAIELVAVHDVVEIEAGDTYAYDVAAQDGKLEREQAAAQTIFSMLPPAQKAHFLALWEEFEAATTPEAVFANALDRLQPLVNNFHSGYTQWQKNHVTYSMVLQRNQKTMQLAPEICAFVLQLLEKAVQQGLLIDDRT